MKKEFVTGKNANGVQKLFDGTDDEYPDEDILCLNVSEEEYDFLREDYCGWSIDNFGIFFEEREFDQISNELVDAFLGKLGDDKDKAPCLYEALITAKNVGGDVYICF